MILAALVLVSLIALRLIGRSRGLTVAYSCSVLSLIGILSWCLVRALVLILILGLPRVLAWPLIRILSRIIRRGNLAVLHIGRWSCLSPVPLLPRGRGGLAGGCLLRVS